MTAAQDCAEPTLAAWRERGAHRFDPVRFRYLEALARRTAALVGETRRLLDRQLSQALAAYAAQLEQARAEAGRSLGFWVQRFPDAAERLHRLHAEGDFRGLRRCVAEREARARRGPLGELVRQLDGHAPLQETMQRMTQEPGTRAEAAASAEPAPTELRALRQFRSTWTRLSVDQQLSRSLEKVPDNPGPLNSQHLVLRSLHAMQGISPAYLDRFVAHVETLLWLEAAGAGGAAAPGQVLRREGERKRKPGRDAAV